MKAIGLRAFFLVVFLTLLFPLAVLIRVHPLLPLIEGAPPGGLEPTLAFKKG